MKKSPIVAPTMISVKKNRASRRKMLVRRRSQRVSFSNVSYCDGVRKPSPVQSFNNSRARRASSPESR